MKKKIISETNHDKENVRKLLNSLGTFIDGILTPDFREFKTRQISSIISNFFDDIPRIQAPEDRFNFPAEVECQINLLLSFFNLYNTFLSLQQCEYYFRRYPFRGAQVSKEDHIRNICEMYFSCLYKLHQRLKNLYSLMSKTFPAWEIDEKGIPALFYDHFRSEMMERNDIHHNSGFEDVAIKRLSLTSLLSTADEFKYLSKMNEVTFRKTRTEWVKRVRKSSRTANIFIESTAKLILAHAEFLNSPE